MTDFYNFIVSATENMNPFLRILIVFVFSGVSFFGLTFIKNESFRKHTILILKNFFKSKSKISLLKHGLFFKKSFYKKAINNLYFENQLKTDLFKILLNEKINAAITLSEQFIKNINYKIDNTKLFYECEENISNIIQVYETTILQSYYEYFFDEKKDYNKKEAYLIATKLYEYIYNNDKTGFKTVHADTVKFIEGIIKKNIFSNIFSVKQKLYFYLDAIEFALDIAVTECEDLFNQFNGEIEKMAII